LAFKLEPRRSNTQQKPDVKRTADSFDFQKCVVLRVSPPPSMINWISAEQTYGYAPGEAFLCHGRATVHSAQTPPLPFSELYLKRSMMGLWVQTGFVHGFWAAAELISSRFGNNSSTQNGAIGGLVGLKRSI